LYFSHGSKLVFFLALIYSLNTRHFQQVADSLGNHADCAKVLGYLYNSEILEEEPIVSWFNEDAGDGIKAQVIIYYKIV